MTREMRLALSRLTVLLTLSGPVAFAAEPGRAPAQGIRANLTLIGSEAATASVREVGSELLEREGVSAAWTSRASFRPQDLFEEPSDRAAAAVAVWIDLSAAGEARLYFRDARSEWFVIRTLPVPELDEMAREQIGHIVASAVVALGTGGGKALTLSQARAVLQPPPAQEKVVLSSPSVGQPPRLELVSWATLQLFAPQKSVTELFGLSVIVARGPRWGQGSGRLGVWVDAGWQFGGTYSKDSVGVDVHAVALRTGLLWDLARLRLLLFRVGLGGGVDYVSYQPQGGISVAVAPGGGFFVPESCLWGAVEFRATEHLALSFRALADLALVRVHYDVDEGNGQRTQVLVPYLFRPGMSLGLAYVY